jgi:hypothetical protein
MIKENYPMRITRDDTEHGVFYYSEKDVMKMLEIARIDERQAIAKWHDKSDAGSTWDSVVQEKIRTGGYLND